MGQAGQQPGARGLCPLVSQQKKISPILAPCSMRGGQVIGPIDERVEIKGIVHREVHADLCR